MCRGVIQGVGPAAVGTHHQLAVAVGLALGAGNKQVVGAVHIRGRQGAVNHLHGGRIRIAVAVFGHGASRNATDHGRVIHRRYRQCKPLRDWNTSVFVVIFHGDVKRCLCGFATVMEKAHQSASQLRHRKAGHIGKTVITCIL